MKIKDLKRIPNSEQLKKLNDAYNYLDRLLVDLRSRTLPNEIIIFINNEIDQINNFTLDSEKELREQLRKSVREILQLLKKELNLVTKQHYQKTWMTKGMVAFGIPIGAILGIILGNLAFLGVGLPIGMSIGTSVGFIKDKRAFQEGRQLNI